MTSCRCEKCCPADPAPTYTAGFKLECLARAVLDLPTLEARRAWLAAWKAKHGTDSTIRLKDEMQRLWTLREQAA